MPSWSCWRATARRPTTCWPPPGATTSTGTVVLDISNPLDFSAGFPPSLFVKDTDSLGEQLQRRFPRLRVVKSLNTLNASLMVEPAALGTSTTVFVSGDDAEAKALVASLLESFGHDDVIDLGGIETARGTEMVLPLWLRLMNALGHAPLQPEGRALSIGRFRRCGRPTTAAAGGRPRPRRAGPRPSAAPAGTGTPRRPRDPGPMPRSSMIWLPSRSGRSEASSSSSESRAIRASRSS